MCVCVFCFFLSPSVFCHVYVRLYFTKRILVCVNVYVCVYMYMH